MNYVVFADGASKGNPGESSIGAVCFRERPQDLNDFKVSPEYVFEISEKIGIRTNNEAEYTALIRALEKLRENEIKKAMVYMDSELVIRQITGVYKVKKENLKPLWQKVMDIKKGLELEFAHVPRDKNQIADYLANRALK